MGIHSIQFELKRLIKFRFQFMGSFFFSFHFCWARRFPSWLWAHWLAATSFTRPVYSPHNYLPCHWSNKQKNFEGLYAAVLLVFFFGETFGFEDRFGLDWRKTGGGGFHGLWNGWACTSAAAQWALEASLLLRFSIVPLFLSFQIPIKRN